MEFYLKQMKEQDAEAGLSLQYKAVNSLEDKLERDADFFEKTGSSYIYGAAFADRGELDEIWKLTDSGLLKNISTLTCEYTEDYPVVSYGTDSITLQCSTSDGMNYTYRGDEKYSERSGVYEYHAEYAGYFLAGAGDGPLGDHAETVFQ